MCHLYTMYFLDKRSPLPYTINDIMGGGGGGTTTTSKSHLVSKSTYTFPIGGREELLYLSMTMEYSHRVQFPLSSLYLYTNTLMYRRSSRQGDQSSTDRDGRYELQEKCFYHWSHQPAGHHRPGHSPPWTTGPTHLYPPP